MTEDTRCPECGSETVVRTAKKGPNAGSSFYVCIRYPDCKGKIAIVEEQDADGFLEEQTDNKIVLKEYKKEAVAGLMYCRNCGKALIGTPEICLGCGAKPLDGNSFCHACGAKTSAIAEYCVKCGARLVNAKPAVPTVMRDLETGLTKKQEKYLRRKKTEHTVGAIVGTGVGSSGIVVGFLSVVGGILAIAFGFILSLTIIGAIIGIPLMLIGAGMLGLGGASTTLGGILTGLGIHSGKKSEDTDDQLHGLNR